jgi:transposase
MKVGNHIYIYEVFGYRDSDGKPRNKKHPVGKVDPQTGQEIFKPDFIPKLAQYGKSVPAQNKEKKGGFSIQDLKTSTIRDYGATYFLEAIAEQIGLKEALAAALDNLSGEILTLAEYLICSEDPFAYCAHWIEGTETAEGRFLSSRRVSDLLHEITAADRAGFFKRWSEYRQEREYLALDITSISSWSELIEDVEWGYNRDGEKLAQINLCMLMGENSRLPVFQTVYSGSLKDVSTFKTTIREVSCYAKGKRLVVVMDKGFYSAKNVNLVLESGEKYGFLMAVPFTTTIAKDLVKREREGIDTPENTLAVNKGAVRLVSRQIVWQNKAKPESAKELTAHVYFNALKAAARKDELYAHVSALMKIAKEGPGKEKLEEEIQKYLAVRKTKTGVTYKINHEVLEKELENSGWLVLITNRIKDGEKALEAYRAKDVVEKGFLKLKNAIDFIRVHSQESMQNKIFIGFIALILLSHINKVMVQKKMYRDMSMKDVLLTLKKLRVQKIAGETILFPVTLEQRSIYKAFSVKPPELS